MNSCTTMSSSAYAAFWNGYTHSIVIPVLIGLVVLTLVALAIILACVVVIHRDMTALTATREGRVTRRITIEPQGATT